MTDTSVPATSETSSLQLLREKLKTEASPAEVYERICQKMAEDKAHMLELSKDGKPWQPPLINPRDLLLGDALPQLRKAAGNILADMDAEVDSNNVTSAAEFQRRNLYRILVDTCDALIHYRKRVGSVFPDPDSVSTIDIPFPAAPTPHEELDEMAILAGSLESIGYSACVIASDVWFAGITDNGGDEPVIGTESTLWRLLGVACGAIDNFDAAEYDKAAAAHDTARYAAAKVAP